MEPEVTNIGTRVPVFDIQPLLTRIIELADVGTLILLLVIFILIGLLASERSRSSTVIKLYMSQSIEIVTVLTSVKNMLDANTRLQELNESAITAVSNKLHEVIYKLDSLKSRAASRKRTSRKKPAEPTDKT